MKRMEWMRGWVGRVALAGALAGAGTLVAREAVAAPPAAGSGGAVVPSLPRPGDAFAPGTFCGWTGWCWYNPLPSGTWWFAVGGAGREVWIGGNTASVLHFDGRDWTSLPLPALMDGVSGIFAPAPNDVWLAGSGLAHWNGHALTAVMTGVGFGQIWGANAHDIYAVGDGGTQHFDGHGWTALPSIQGSTVSGGGPRDVWVGASDGLWHFDGTTWARSGEFEARYVVGVTATARDDVWVLVRYSGHTDVEHFDGKSWTVSYHLPDAEFTVNVWGIGSGGRNDVWVVGDRYVDPVLRGYLLHFDGSAWTEAPTAPTSMMSMQVAGRRHLAVGQGGGILELNQGRGARWADLRSGTAETLSGVWGSSPQDMWAVGGAGAALHSDGRTTRTVPTAVTVALADAWGTSTQDVWAVGAGGTALHFDGATFTPVATGVTADLKAVFTAQPGDAWIGGAEATLLRWQNGALAAVPLPGSDPSQTIFDIHGTRADDLWLTGGGSTGAFVSHFDGTIWSPVQALNFNAGGYPGKRIWALAANDVWMFTRMVFRGQASYWHYDGATWTEVFTHPTPDQWMFPQPGLGGSFVFSPTERWFVGPVGAFQRSTAAP